MDVVQTCESNGSQAHLCSVLCASDGAEPRNARQNRRLNLDEEEEGDDDEEGNAEEKKDGDEEERIRRACAMGHRYAYTPLLSIVSLRMGNMCSLCGPTWLFARLRHVNSSTGASPVRRWSTTRWLSRLPRVKARLQWSASHVARSSATESSSTIRTALRMYLEGQSDKGARESE